VRAGTCAQVAVARRRGGRPVARRRPARRRPLASRKTREAPRRHRL